MFSWLQRSLVFLFGLVLCMKWLLSPWVFEVSRTVSVDEIEHLFRHNIEGLQTWVAKKTQTPQSHNQTKWSFYVERGKLFLGSNCKMLCWDSSELVKGLLNIYYDTGFLCPACFIGSVCQLTREGEDLVSIGSLASAWLHFDHSHRQTQAFKTAHGIIMYKGSYDFVPAAFITTYLWPIGWLDTCLEYSYIHIYIYNRYSK